MMRVRSASAPAPGRPVNEDLVFRFGPLVGVLDGATVPDGFDTGCVHGPEWYVRHLAARIGVAEAARPAATLTSNLAAAILAVRADHGGQCDLDHPGTPSSTVCLLRDCGDQVDYLVLCDSPLVLDAGGQVSVVTDNRLDTAMAELRETVARPCRAARRTRSTRFRHAVTRAAGADEPHARLLGRGCRPGRGLPRGDRHRCRCTVRGRYGGRRCSATARPARSSSSG